MSEVYADSGYFDAMYDPRGVLHQKARDVTARLGSFRIVTSEMVLVEFLNHVSKGDQLVRRRAADAERTMRTTLMSISSRRPAICSEPLPISMPTVWINAGASPTVSAF